MEGFEGGLRNLDEGNRELLIGSGTLGLEWLVNRLWDGWDI